MASGTKHYVYLVPGFFGFTQLGDLPYFAHVRELLAHFLSVRGIDAEVIPVHTWPTASLRHRAVRLIETIHDTSPDGGPIHLVGHSSGGLDARLFVSPGVHLPTSLPAKRYADRVRTVVLLACPNYGTPSASVFTGVVGQKLLEFFSLFTMYVLRFGRIPLSVVTQLVGVFTRLDDLVRLNRSVLDQVYDQLLQDFSEERRQLVIQFLKEVGHDQALLPQITPEGIDVFNSVCTDRSGVHYGSVLTHGRPPSLGSIINYGFDPYLQATHLLYRTLYMFSSRLPENRRVQLREEHRSALAHLNGIEDKASDGVVPTLSQPWGEIIHVARADHLDVIGHFEDPRSDPPHFDWLASASGFRRVEFSILWRAVADYIRRSADADS